MDMRLTNTMAKMLKDMLNENPSLPVVVVGKGPNDEESSSLVLTIEDIEVGKIQNDPALLCDDIGIVSDEELRVMLHDEMEQEYGRAFYDTNPKEYMRIFTEKASRFKKQWKAAIVIHVEMPSEF